MEMNLYYNDTFLLFSQYSNIVQNDWFKCNFRRYWCVCSYAWHWQL